MGGAKTWKRRRGGEWREGKNGVGKKRMEGKRRKRKGKEVKGGKEGTKRVGKGWVENEVKEKE